MTGVQAINEPSDVGPEAAAPHMLCRACEDTGLAVVEKDAPRVRRCRGTERRHHSLGSFASSLHSLPICRCGAGALPSKHGRPYLAVTVVVAVTPSMFCCSATSVDVGLWVWSHSPWRWSQLRRRGSVICASMTADDGR